MSLPIADVTRTRLTRELRRVLDPDPGSFQLADSWSRPSLTDDQAAAQRVWAGALVALHGAGRVAAAYAPYARARQLELALSLPSLTTWLALPSPSEPAVHWPDDPHGFLCRVCRTRWPQVLVSRDIPVCGPCGQLLVTNPQKAVPLWRAHSHNALASPGHGGRAPTIRLPGLSPHRNYTAGDAALFLRGGLSGPTKLVIHVDVDHVDLPAISIRSAIHRGPVRLSIESRYVYDPVPEGHEYHAYGFRFTSATVTAVNGSSAHYDDVYELLHALSSCLVAPARCDPTASIASPTR